MNHETLEIHGTVRRGTLDAGSKSERVGLILDTDRGSYALRRKGGPAFGDTELNPLEGKAIVAAGLGIGRMLIMERWNTVD